jgi:hypothetical protein
MALELVPDVPFVECDLDRSGGEAEINSIDLCEVDERFADFDVPLSGLVVSDGFISRLSRTTYSRSEYIVLVL